MMGSLGICVELCSLKKFSETCTKLNLPITGANLLMRDFHDLLKKNENLFSDISVSTAHFEQDRKMKIDGLYLEQLAHKEKQYNQNFVKDGIRDLLHDNFFPNDSLGTSDSFERCLKIAVEETRGLVDLGIFRDLVTSGWNKIFSSVKSKEDANPAIQYRSQSTVRDHSPVYGASPQSTSASPIYLRSTTFDTSPSGTKGTGLKFLSKCILARRCVISTKSLLYLTDREKHNSEILQQNISRPIFLVGLSKPALALVHAMFARDHQRFRCPNRCEMLFPYGEKGDFRPEGLETNDLESWEQVGVTTCITNMCA